MRIKLKEIIIYLSSISVLTLFFFFSINNLIKKPFEVINFIDSQVHEDFEFEVTNNLNDINNYLKKYLFIESHSLKRQSNEINIQINLKKPFAINKSTNEVIFYNNITAPINYFNLSFLESIELVDISNNSIHINNYLNEHYLTLSNIFNIEQIEYVDDRRYNLILSNDTLVMLPKVIDSRLLFFIRDNIDLIEKNTKYKDFLDLRNFHNKTIRLK